MSSTRRRVWVARESGKATSVFAGPDDLFDDLKSAAIVRFPASLLHSYDLCDIHIVHYYEDSHSLGHQRHVVFAEHLNVFKTLDLWFPNGYLHNDILYLVVARTPTENLQPPPQVLQDSLSTPIGPYTNFNLASAPFSNFSASYLPHPLARHALPLAHLPANINTSAHAHLPANINTSAYAHLPANINTSAYAHLPQPPPIRLPLSEKLTRFGHSLSLSDPLPIGRPVLRARHQLAADLVHITPHARPLAHADTYPIAQSPVATSHPHLDGPHHHPLDSHRHSKRSLLTDPTDLVDPAEPGANASANPSLPAILLLPKNFLLANSVEADKGKSAALDNVDPKALDASGNTTESDTSKGDTITIDVATKKKHKSLDDLSLKPARDRNGSKHKELVDGGDDLHANLASTPAPSVPNPLKTSAPVAAPSTDKLKPARARVKHTGRPLTTEKVLPSILVLVVEDNAINQAILGAFLRKHKILYQIAKNGQEAVDMWRMGRFHLVLMDIQLPVKSGIEATKEIRNLERLNHIGVFAENEYMHTNTEVLPSDKLQTALFRLPVIIVALTASLNSLVDKKNALMAGCNDFLTKPVNLVWLQNKITEWGCMQALIDFDGWKSRGEMAPSVSAKKALKS